MASLFPKIVIAVSLLVVIVVFARTRRGGRPRRHGSSGSLGAAMQNIEGLFVESKKHVIEVQQDEHSDHSDSGEPPEK